MNRVLIPLTVCFFVAAASGAHAACPVGKDEGDTWCESGKEWKCERCGSEYCPIITGNSCHAEWDR